MKLPVQYKGLSISDKRLVREEYMKLQNGLCYYCGDLLSEQPKSNITSKKINWKLFTPNFLKYPIHLQHCHRTGWTEGVVHAYCNAVMWQYEGR